MFFGSLIKEILQRQEDSRVAEVKELRAHNRELVDTIIQMKKEGFMAPPLVHHFEQQDPLPNEIMVAIDAVATEGTTLYNDLLDYARGKRMMEVPDDVIADEIYEGGSYKDFD